MRAASSLMIPVLVAVTASCGGGATEPDTGGGGSGGQTSLFTLTFKGDGTFQTVHGGQPIAVALVEPSAVTPVKATRSGTVSATEDPAFSFVFDSALLDGHTYRVDYWIDSNFGGGTAGVCDPKSFDHQWSLDLGTVTGDVSVEVSHSGSTTTDVCSSFP